MDIDFVMNGDLLPISAKGDGVVDDLFVVTAITWTGDGQVELFGYGLMGTYTGPLSPRPYGFKIEVWSSVWA